MFDNGNQPQNHYFFHQTHRLSRASEAGVCRGSDTPTIYVGDIDMYTPLEKPNT